MGEEEACYMVAYIHRSPLFLVEPIVMHEKPR